MIIQLIAILFFAAFADFLLPDGKYTKYISFVLGLVLIAVALQPALSLKDISLPQEWEVSLPEITQKADEAVDSLFSQKLEEYLTAELGIEAKVTATAKGIVAVEAAEGDRSEIAELLGITEEKVWISR